MHRGRPIKRSRTGRTLPNFTYREMRPGTSFPPFSQYMTGRHFKSWRTHRVDTNRSLNPGMFHPPSASCSSPGILLSKYARPTRRHPTSKLCISSPVTVSDRLGLTGENKPENWKSRRRSRAPSESSPASKDYFSIRLQKRAVHREAYNSIPGLGHPALSYYLNSPRMFWSCRPAVGAREFSSSSLSTSGSTSFRFIL